MQLGIFIFANQNARISIKDRRDKIWFITIPKFKKPNFRSVNLTVQIGEKQVILNPNLLYKENYESIKFKDLLRIYKNYIQSKPITITVVGNKEAIDMEKLADFGEIIEVSKKDIFN